jgi:hypothetical protein
VGARISTGDSTPVATRLPPDLIAALRAHADENGETISDALRTGALMVLGICPTCGQKAPAPVAAVNEPDPGKDRE